MFGYTGRLLFVNLSDGKSEKIAIGPEILKLSLGGRGLGAQLLYDLCPPRIDPFDPAVPFMVLTGPTSGTAVLASCKHLVVTKSPATGGWLDSYSSGHMATHLKFAGLDGIIIRGQAKKPCYLRIDDDQVEIRDASHLWGKDAFETESWLRENISEEGGKMAIGPAGENRIPFACINSDFYRQMGRGGAGAVMGGKNLKAIVVNGSKGISVADPKGILRKLGEVLQLIGQSPSAKNWFAYGTTLTFNITNEWGILPTRNFQSNVFPSGSGRIDKDGVLPNKVGNHGCYGCALVCSKIIEVKGSEGKGVRLEGPEYETLALLGANLAIDDLSFVGRANILCDRLGLDTMSMGVALGFAMECYEKGILTRNQTDGVELRFGNQEACLELIEKTARRQGVGALLALGVRGMAQRLGGGSEKFAMHVKGLEFAGYEPRGTFGTALNYAVNPRGACHRKAWPPSVEILRGHNPYTTEGKAPMLKAIYDTRALLNHLIVCDFHAGVVPVPLSYYAESLSMVTGEDFDVDRLYWITERTENLTRMFNIREGFGVRDDRMPARIHEDPLPEGPAKGQFIKKEDFDSMLREYYSVRGWGENGVPTPGTLAKYHLKW